MRRQGGDPGLDQLGQELRDWLERGWVAPDHGRGVQEG
jgi:hypothetical protein